MIMLWALSEVPAFNCGFIEYGRNLLSVAGANIAAERAIKLTNSIVSQNQGQFKIGSVKDIFKLKEHIIQQSTRSASAKKHKFYAKIADSISKKINIDDMETDYLLNQLNIKYVDPPQDSVLSESS